MVGLIQHRNPPKRMLPEKTADPENDEDDFAQGGKRQKTELETWFGPFFGKMSRKDDGMITFDDSSDDDYDDNEVAPHTRPRTLIFGTQDTANTPTHTATNASSLDQRDSSMESTSSSEQDREVPASVVTPCKCRGKTKGEPCQSAPLPGSFYCYHHRNSEDTCCRTNSTGEPCGCPTAPGSLYCFDHTIGPRCIAVSKGGLRCRHAPTKEGSLCLYHHLKQSERIRGPNGFISDESGDATSNSGEDDRLLGDDHQVEQPQRSSGDGQCITLNIRNHRCGKPVYGQNMYCFAHMIPENRTRTLFDVEDLTQVNFAPEKVNDASNAGLAQANEATDSADDSSNSSEESDNRRPIVKRGRRFGISIFSKQKIMSDSLDFDSDDNSQAKAASDEFDFDDDVQCVAMLDSGRRRCVLVATMGSRFCAQHVDTSKPTGCQPVSGQTDKHNKTTPTAQDSLAFAGLSETTVQDERGKDEEVAGEEDDDDTYISLEDHETRCTSHLPTCTQQAASAAIFYNLRFAASMKSTNENDMKPTAQHGDKIRFYCSEPRTSQCEYTNNTGQLCPFIADDDSIHCRFHRGSGSARCKFYVARPGIHPCDAYCDDAGEAPCPFQAEDSGRHCHIHRGSGNSVPPPTTNVITPETAKNNRDAYSKGSKEQSQNVSVNSDPEDGACCDKLFFCDKHLTAEVTDDGNAINKPHYKKDSSGVSRSMHCPQGNNPTKMATRASARLGVGKVLTGDSLRSIGAKEASTADQLDTIDQTDGAPSTSFKLTHMGKLDPNYEFDRGDASSDDDSTERPFSYGEFLAMWGECEELCGEDTDQIEGSRRVRGANSKVSPEDTNGQTKAQYGRLLPRAMKTLVTKHLGLTKGDVFLDIGHGIGNTCLQAAFMIGCEARGIEVVHGRNSIAEVFAAKMLADSQKFVGRMPVGEVKLRHGRLEDPANHEFLTKGVTRCYVNNFNGVFAHRSIKKRDTYFLDDYIAGLFAMMAPGAIMVTMHPLTLGATRNEANETRGRHLLEESENASFYDVSRIELGKACDTVKWNQHSGNKKSIYIYKHVRLQQPSEQAVFLCCNPSCQMAKDAIPIPAIKKTEEGRAVMNHCSCKFSRKNLRRERQKPFSHNCEVL